MGVAGEKAYGRMRPEDGSGSYRMYLMDGVYRVNGKSSWSGVPDTENGNLGREKRKQNEDQTGNITGLCSHRRKLDRTFTLCWNR